MISPTKTDGRSVVRLYHEGLSAQQVADKVGMSKQAVLARLRRFDVRWTPGRGRAPGNFRYRNPPYGYRVREGQLVLDKKEMKVVRLIVQLRDRTSTPWTRILSHLNGLEIRTRRGKTWSRAGLKRVHKRWTGKV